MNARIVWNHLLYGSIAGLGAAIAWPHDKALTWYFWAGVALQVANAWKALISKGGQSQEAGEGEIEVPAQTLKVGEEESK